MRKKTALLLALFLTAVPAANADSELQTRIFDYFMGRALKGDRNAQYVIGERYETGLGTDKNIVKAHEWYTKAAAQGDERARARLDKRDAPATPDEATPPTKAAATPVETDAGKAPEHLPKKQKTTAAKAADRKKEGEKTARVIPAVTQPAHAVMEPVPAPLATAPPPSLSPSPPPPEPAPIDAMGVVMNAKWARNGRPAEILPSDLASCLPASETEMVCFSEKIVRETGDATVTYTVKSTLSRFTRDGGFTLNYVFNVLRIRGAGEANPVNSAEELTGIAMKPGWQEPGILLQCKIGDGKTLTCSGGGQNGIRFTKS